ncbi:hypothetical protein C8R44DRAFT_340025 [Mycena epipterygia]|nr:hypothetical protein C8R44DRAFT_340025 [Mycena epipterygia]
MGVRVDGRGDEPGVLPPCGPRGDGADARTLGFRHLHISRGVRNTRRWGEALFRGHLRARRCELGLRNRIGGYHISERTITSKPASRDHYSRLAQPLGPSSVLRISPLSTYPFCALGGTATRVAAAPRFQQLRGSLPLFRYLALSPPTSRPCRKTRLPRALRTPCLQGSLPRVSADAGLAPNPAPIQEHTGSGCNWRSRCAASLAGSERAEPARIWLFAACLRVQAPRVAGMEHFSAGMTHRSCARDSMPTWVRGEWEGWPQLHLHFGSSKLPSKHPFHIYSCCL